jgi:hypothetical protein
MRLSVAEASYFCTPVGVSNAFRRKSIPARGDVEQSVARARGVDPFRIAVEARKCFKGRSLTSERDRRVEHLVVDWPPERRTIERLRPVRARITRQLLKEINL